MSEKSSQDPFFIGWSGRLPAGLGRFYLGVGAFILMAFAGLGLLLGLQVDDPSRNLFSSISPVAVPAPQPWLGDQAVSGVLTLAPYPVLHVMPDAGGRVERSILLSNSGKSGATVPADAGRVEAAGGILRRGDIEMLVLDDPPKPTGAPATAPVAQSLGRWRSVGEICDGKCYPGGMTPASGLAHRACASLCLLGDVPAVFVTAAPVAGQSFLLLAGPDGERPGAWMQDYIARPVELEGEVVRLGAILIFRVDSAKVRQL